MEQNGNNYAHIHLNTDKDPTHFFHRKIKFRGFPFVSQFEYDHSVAPLKKGETRGMNKILKNDQSICSCSTVMLFELMHLQTSINNKRKAVFCHVNIAWKSYTKRVRY